jgi:hypothetical protein
MIDILLSIGCRVTKALGENKGFSHFFFFFFFFFFLFFSIDHIFHNSPVRPRIEQRSCSVDSCVVIGLFLVGKKKTLQPNKNVDKLLKSLL